MAGHPPPGCRTFEEIAEEMGVSHQRVHQIYSAAMGKLQRRYGRDVQSLLRWAAQERNLSRMRRTARKACSV